MTLAGDLSGYSYGFLFYSKVLSGLAGSFFSLLPYTNFPHLCHLKKRKSMAVVIKVPSVGESINEVTLVKWLKPEGAWVERDEVIAELESEKATFEINAEQAGILHQ